MTKQKLLTAEDLDRLDQRNSEGFGISRTEFIQLISTARAALRNRPETVKSPRQLEQEQRALDTAHFVVAAWRAHQIGGDGPEAVAGDRLLCHLADALRWRPAPTVKAEGASQ